MNELPSKSTEPTPAEHFHGVRQGVKLRGKQVSEKPLLFQYEVVEMMPVSEHERLRSAAETAYRQLCGYGAFIEAEALSSALAPVDHNEEEN